MNDLDEYELLDISNHPCHYCDLEPSKMIDLIDPLSGYKDDNVIPCCTICKMAKGTMSYDQFNKWIDRLVDAYS